MAKMNDMIATLEEKLTVSQAAEILGVTPQCVRDNYIGKGQLPATLVLGRYLIEREDLARFKRRNRPTGVNLRFRQAKRKRRKSGS